MSVSVSGSGSASTSISASAPGLFSSTRCDVCDYADGHNNLVMIRCMDCHLCVHRDCYGMPTYSKQEFQCWACQAIGRTFRVHDKDGNPLELEQTERPAHCDFCGHNPLPITPTPVTSVTSVTPPAPNSTIHAMHPVYDNYGRRARQLYVTQEDGTHRLVWAHTLCGFFISVKHLLYGTSRDGTTHEGEESDKDDARSLNPELVDDSDGEDDDQEDLFNGFAPTHHFVMYTDRSHRKTVRDHQLALTCEICTQSDATTGCRRIAFQCTAGDGDEYPPFRSTHNKSLANGETCFREFHVGCLRWGKCAPSDAYANPTSTAVTARPKKGDDNMRRVFFFPGLPADDALEPIHCLYCPRHAADVNTKEQPQQQAKEDAASNAAREKRKQAMKSKQGLSLSLNDYTVHESTSEQANAVAKNTAVHSNEEPSLSPRPSKRRKSKFQEGVPLLEQMKQDLAEKVIHVTKENSKTFIKEEKKLWQRLCMSKDVEGDEFQNMWVETKAFAFQVWQQRESKSRKYNE